MGVGVGVGDEVEGSDEDENGGDDFEDNEIAHDVCAKDASSPLAEGVDEEEIKEGEEESSASRRQDVWEFPKSPLRPLNTVSMVFMPGFIATNTVRMSDLRQVQLVPARHNTPTDVAER